MAFHANQRVQAHPSTDAWMSGDRFGSIEAIGSTYILVKMDRSRKVLKFPKSEGLLIPVVRIAPTIPQNAVGTKVFYLTVDGRKVTGVVESIDSVTHPSRLNVRITATRDKHFPKGTLVNTPPAFVQVR